MKFSTKRQLYQLTKFIFNILLIISIGILSSYSALGNPNLQGRTITGKVTSSEDPSGLPGANVLIKGTAQGTVTDVEGNYSLEVPGDDAILVFSSARISRVRPRVDKSLLLSRKNGRIPA